MFTRGLILFALAISLWACGNSGEENAADTAQEQAGATSEANGQTFGDAVTAEGAINYEDLYQQMNAADSLPAKVIGMVDQVCQVKGCWMDIVAQKEGVEPMRVSFKDYGFFVPKDIAGRQVIMEGYAYREVTTVDELRHYAEDEGLSKEEIEKITEPIEELKFLASGVLLLDGDSTN
ncbi:MAG: DUF4920 domain-containing protein [Saprospiraceae bacterium]|nr:DUF4920 domain-containing protein [Saprospiraceae bacterium]MCB0626220.1 DUF4920 domain-containing protein [Saprospiraceae bacterium]MCB0678215.1 DUF4920 domain-containing protein [Saprospiraceae bacterium]MCB0680013.1 DUF4920 domain-containing protein [Saprospiraceae bacterium]